MSIRGLLQSPAEASAGLFAFRDTDPARAPTQSCAPQLRSACLPSGVAGPQLRSACHPSGPTRSRVSRKGPETILLGGNSRNQKKLARFRKSKKFWMCGCSDFWSLVFNFGILEFDFVYVCSVFCSFVCCLFVVLGFRYAFIVFNVFLRVPKAASDFRCTETADDSYHH